MSVQVFANVKPGMWVGLPGKFEGEATDIGISSNVGVRVDLGKSHYVAPELTAEHSTKVGWMVGGRVGSGVFFDKDKKVTIGTYIEGGKITGKEKAEYSGTFYYGAGIRLGSPVASVDFGLRHFNNQAGGSPTYSMGFGLSFTHTIKR